MSLGSSSEIPDSLRLGHKFIAAGSQQLPEQNSFPVNLREWGCHINTSPPETRLQRRSETTSSYCLNLSARIEEIHSKVSLAKRRDARKMTLEEISCLISREDSSELAKPGKINFFSVEVMKLNLAFLAVFWQIFLLFH